MQDVDLACRLVEEVKAHTGLPVSVKTRLGWENPQDILTFAPRLVAAGADRLEIHARTKVAGYQGKSNWYALKQLDVAIPVVVNGDIVDHQTPLQAMEQSGTKAVMVGRALLGHPWRLCEIASNKKATLKMPDLVLTHLDFMLSHYGHKGIYIARKHLAWYAFHKKGVAKWRKKMYLEEDEKRLKKLIQDFWEGEAS